MPWEATSAVEERKKFIKVAKESGDSFARVCRGFGISRTAGYKWLARFEEGGEEGLKERSRAAGSLPHRTKAKTEEDVVALRKGHPSWGPKKLLHVLELKRPEEDWPAASTIGEILKRRGLVAKRQRRARTVWSGVDVEEAEFPNDSWAMDFKGHFGLTSGKRCHPFTVTDLFSRYLIKCEGLPNESWRPVKSQLEMAFREFGLPERIRSDNGAPFSSLAVGGLCWLSVWLIQLGVTPERIRPSSPQENGSHERMHRTLKAEATRPPQATFTEQQRVFDEFRRGFNDERPHESLGMRTPSEVFSRSHRAFPEVLRQPEYPDNFLLRRTDSNGVFSFKGAYFKTSKTLQLSCVGLCPIDEELFELFYGPLSLGFIETHPKPQFLRE